ncbi:opsin-5-like [Ruditapes philippinarum]|uniref:opsin-5-like n=1 Tax=Ruditapes philippinarum TaxID=129788 RepID=UPI00295B33F4|nr:opsin-5-like [Ruditapes philippinarum]
MGDAVEASVQFRNKSDVNDDTVDTETDALSKLHNWEDDIVGGYLVIIFILALTLNALVIYTCLHNWKSLIMSDYYILNLAFSDVILPISAFPLPISSSFNHHWLYGKTGCVAYGFLGFFFGLVSITTLTLMGLTRYISICHPHINISSKRFIKNTILFTYAYSITWSSLPLTGWGSYSLESYGTSCTLQWDENRVFITLMSIFCISMPSVIMVISYTLIFHRSRSSHRTVRGSNTNTTKMSRKESYLIKITFAMCWGFMISWLPYAVVSMWTAYGDITMLPIRLTVGAVLLAKTSTVVNPVIYFLLSNKFRPLLIRSLNCRGIHLIFYKQRKKCDMNKATIPLMPVECTPRHESNPIHSSDTASNSESIAPKLLENFTTVDL